MRDCIVAVLMAFVILSGQHLAKVCPEPAIECLQERAGFQEPMYFMGSIINNTPVKVSGELRVHAIHKPTCLGVTQYDDVWLMPFEQYGDTYEFINLFNRGYWISYTTFHPLEQDWFIASEECTTWYYDGNQFEY